MVRTHESHPLSNQALKRLLAAAVSLWWASTVATAAEATAAEATAAEEAKPNIIFVMADDMGWGQTGYRQHPVLETPSLDAMAANGLRFERFYAGCPVCSPTRASVLTGRSPDRTGVLTHGYALRLQEKTVAQALKAAGYVTGHFGKWHLNGFKGPGAPILRDDPRSPGAFGFDEWVSVTNFYDVDPLMSRGGEIEQLSGDSSEIAVDQAVKFLDKHRGGGTAMFAVVWFGTPHSPFKALPKDKSHFQELDEASTNHHGELVAMDRAVGTLRMKLREFDIADNTLLVFCSDNGGLPGIKPDTVGGLSGNKGSVYEGGLRVPGIIEWPSVVRPRVTDHPACTMDLFPTVADIVGLPADVFVKPLDGISLKPLLTAEIGERDQPIPFRFGQQVALIDNRYKLLSNDRRKDGFQLYDLSADPQESRDVSGEHPDVFSRMKRELLAWNDGVDASFAGRDYPSGNVSPPDPESIFWYDAPAYAPYLAQWKDRWEFKSYIDRRRKSVGSAPPQ
ncbi:MAG: sulfatase-like hydrolase/transferase [Planctomycetota bacterium]|nr:sulfatase-like hydrolase/transferase [Planctomycetota bacterium]